MTEFADFVMRWMISIRKSGKLPRLMMAPPVRAETTRQPAGQGRGSQPQKEMIILAKTKKNRTDLAAERYSIPADGAHAADTLINVLFDDLEPQDKLSLLWMGMGMAAVRKNDSQNNHDGVE